MTKRDFTKQSTEALRIAVEKVMAERRQAGRTVPVWKDGRVQHILPPVPVPASRKAR